MSQDQSGWEERGAQERLGVAEALGLGAAERSVALSRLEAGGLRLEPAGPEEAAGLARWFEEALLERSRLARPGGVGARGLGAPKALLEAGWARVAGPGRAGSVAARALEKACSGRDLGLLELLLEHGADPHWSPGEHFFKTPMGRALEHNWEAGARALSARLRPEHFSQRSISGMGLLEALFLARGPAVWGKRQGWAPELGREWVAKGARPDERVGKARQSGALMLIRKEAFSEAVMSFLGLGADVDSPDAEGATLLMAASRLGQAATAMALLDAGAKPGALDAKGQSALDHARACRSAFAGPGAAAQEELVNRLIRLRRVEQEAAAMERALGEEDARLGRLLRQALGDGASLEWRGRSWTLQELLGEKPESSAPRPRPGL